MKKKPNTARNCTKIEMEPAERTLTEEPDIEQGSSGAQFMQCEAAEPHQRAAKPAT
ncbi:MAG: hypothetical protein IPG46_20050 [Actinobacteria bacterium]|nr:hypothetical protein [Actinomycetota bacterium]